MGSCEEVMGALLNKVEHLLTLGYGCSIVMYYVALQLISSNHLNPFDVLCWSSNVDRI